MEVPRHDFEAILIARKLFEAASGGLFSDAIDRPYHVFDEEFPVSSLKGHARPRGRCGVLAVTVCLQLGDDGMPPWATVGSFDIASYLVLHCSLLSQLVSNTSSVCPLAPTW